MDDKKMNKKRLVLILIITLVLVALAVYFIKYRNTGPSHAEKVEILKKLNEDSANTPPVPTKEKETIIKNMNTDSKQLTPEEKSALIKGQVQGSGGFRAPSQKDTQTMPVAPTK